MHCSWNSFFSLMSQRLVFEELSIKPLSRTWWLNSLYSSGLSTEVLALICNKKHKNSLETRVESAVVRAYVENQATLEPILVCVQQNIKKQKSRAVEIVCESPFYLPMWLISGFFLFSVKMQTCQAKSDCAKNVCNFSMKIISTISNIEHRAKLEDRI